MNDLEGLAIVLFKQFTRMEYALKAIGYHRGEGPARADWNAFAKDHSETILADNECQESIFYLSQNPPAEQIVRNGALEFRAVPSTNNGIRDILTSVRRVRNNLFHGGKYTKEPEAAERNQILIKHAIFMLEGCLRASDQLREAYDN
jgi:hypothetical protein